MCHSCFTRKAFMEKQTVEKQVIERQTYAIGDRVEKLCAVRQEERGHAVASITKTGTTSGAAKISILTADRCASMPTGWRPRSGSTWPACAATAYFSGGSWRTV